ncbi:MAG: hypothetical protein V3W14_07975 [Candidatus Neomarinimicrobiota bacterium]
MHPKRQKRVSQELKNASALSLTLTIEMKLGDGAITNTLTFSGMPTLLFKAKGKHIVKCLPLNQAGVGDSRDEAFKILGIDLVDAFTEALAESTLNTVVKDMLNGRPAELYWDVYTRLAKKKVEPKKIERRIENIELQTDTVIDPVLMDTYKNFPVSAVVANG